jgi:3-methyladenine DNA glycosylase AlkD
VNNWDLVDLSAPNILGTWLLDHPREVLDVLARSPELWDRRIAVLATFAFIRARQYADTLRLVEILLTDRQDLLHKACGWMLREVGKRDLAVLIGFLERHASRMPRTMLRYAIEKLPPSQRQAWLER